jgi:hypothetical protein
MSRRDFLKEATAGGALLFADTDRHPQETLPMLPELSRDHDAPVLSLSPASWIWYPSGRTLPNTFVLFRTTFELRARPIRATGWVSADSRYMLTVNGTRLQRGPAPCDPRHLEADPVDCTALLSEGTNALGATVLYYGHGDGTAPFGKPGFIFLLSIACQDGSTVTVASGETWLSRIALSWPPGHYRRWYLRALQEEFDARTFPYGWDRAEYSPGNEWVRPMRLNVAPDKPPVASTYPDDLNETSTPPEICSLRRRTIPFMREEPVSPARLAASHIVRWNHPVEQYFDFAIPSAYTAGPGPFGPGPLAPEYRSRIPEEGTLALTFEFTEQIVGYPAFDIDAPEGTTVELLVQEAHADGGPPLLNTHFHSWARFICRAGLNRFETFDYESLKWLQIHIREAKGTISVSNVRVLRRLYSWPACEAPATDDPKIDRLLSASVNTLLNSAQETIVDGMGRERQQYSGDASHQLHGIYFACGDPRLPARFITTFSQGITLDGYFFDCWPAWDRLARAWERHTGSTPWGPILDHSVGFVFDCRHYLMHTGDLEPLREAYPRLQRFLRYLRSIRHASSGLLPVADLGLPSVWIDHDAYLRGHQHHKQCAFNLYAAAMLTHAFPAVAGALGDRAWAEASRQLGESILEATIRAFWDEEHSLFVVNRPWLGSEKAPRLCDRSLATAVLFDQCPGGATAGAVRALADVPPEMGLSYPANAGWRLWALCRAGRTDAVLRDLRTRWWEMASVHSNNTLQEAWKALPDSNDLWSHCAIVPLYMMYMGIAGIEPVEPGFARFRIRPQPADLRRLEFAVPAPSGTLRFRCEGSLGKRALTITAPERAEGDLILDARESTGLTPLADPVPAGTRSYRITRGATLSLTLTHT